MIKMELAELPMISLQRQALTNFASSVCISVNKTSLLSALGDEPLKNRAIAQLKSTNIPTLFKEMTMMILTDVGREIREWLYEIYDHVPDTTLEHQVANLSWTVEGSLNRPKMAMLLLENDSDLDLSFSFKMACEYCLEDKVRELWPRIGEERQLKGIYREYFMVKYWIYKLNEHLDLSFPSLDLLLDLYERSTGVKNLLRLVFSYCNIETVKFLFNGLNEEEKIEALNVFKSWCLFFSPPCDESVFAYMLSKFNVMQMCDFISGCSIHKLMSHFNYFAWPNTEFVKAFVSKMKGTVNATNGNDLLKLADGSLGFFRRYNQKILFRYCWTRFTKEALKEAIKDDSSFLPEVFSQLCRNEDDVSIKMVIDSVGAKGYPKSTFRRCETIQTLAKYDSSLLKYYLARTLYKKSLAENLIQVSKDNRDLVPFKDMITDILIEVFPHWNLNRFD